LKYKIDIDILNPGFWLFVKKDQKSEHIFQNYSPEKRKYIVVSSIVY